MNETEPSQETPKKSAPQADKTSSTLNLHELIVDLAPHVAPQLGPWLQSSTQAKSSDLARTKDTEDRNALTSTITIISIVFIVCCLAFAAIYYGHASIAEKIAIGLLAFLAGMNTRR